MIIYIIFLLFMHIDASSLELKQIDRIVSKNYDKYIALDDYNAEGKVTLYAKTFHKKVTSSGMRYLSNAYTAASLKLPLMSIVTITNIRNNQSLDVLINDRGLYNSNAILDLSQGAALAIALHSADKILVEFNLEKTLAFIADKRLLEQFYL